MRAQPPPTRPCQPSTGQHPPTRQDGVAALHRRVPHFVQGPRQPLLRQRGDLGVGADVCACGGVLVGAAQGKGGHGGDEEGGCGRRGWCRRGTLQQQARCGWEAVRRRGVHSSGSGRRCTQSTCQPRQPRRCASPLLAALCALFFFERASQHPRDEQAVVGPGVLHVQLLRHGRGHRVDRIQHSVEGRAKC